MSVPVTCPSCSTYVGSQSALAADTSIEIDCRGTSKHEQPYSEIIKTKLFSTISVKKTHYPELYDSETVEIYNGPLSGPKFWLLVLYIKFLRKDIFIKNKSWLFHNIGIRWQKANL